MNTILAQILGKVYLKLNAHISSCIVRYQKTLFKTCGNNVNISKGGVFTYGMISIGNDVFINANVVMISRNMEMENGGGIFRLEIMWR